MSVKGTRKLKELLPDDHYSRLIMRGIPREVEESGGETEVLKGRRED